MQGTAVEFDDGNLARLTDIGKIRKLYKLGGVGVGVGEVDPKGKRRRKDGSVEGSRGGGVVDGGKGGKGGGDGGGKGEEAERERERKELEVAVLGLMALRGAV